MSEGSKQVSKQANKQASKYGRPTATDGRRVRKEGGGRGAVQWNGDGVVVGEGTSGGKGGGGVWQIEEGRVESQSRKERKGCEGGGGDGDGSGGG
ncbi:hypothetical protein M0802_007300 [Mischocyttarus mexicanus]|nr:hypothetical protein M0802_007300 [Mischocyttarus mexicanus]